MPRGVPPMPAFFDVSDSHRRTFTGYVPMDKSKLTMGATDRRSGCAALSSNCVPAHGPKSVTVVLSEETLVVTLSWVYLCRPPRKPWLRHRRGPLRYRIFTASCSPTRPTHCGGRSSESTGVDAREATAEVETKTAYGRASSKSVHDWNDGAGKVSARPRHTRDTKARQWNKLTVNMSMECHNDAGPYEKVHGIGLGWRVWPP